MLSKVYFIEYVVIEPHFLRKYSKTIEKSSNRLAFPIENVVIEN